MVVTKNFQAFVDAVNMNYREVYDFYQGISERLKISSWLKTVK